ncbi:MAG: hypothetical protein KDA61_19175 [Planctomycetales bacterium]|nr:hypothetical protein [Planctomycetales bacterium]
MTTCGRWLRAICCLWIGATTATAARATEAAAAREGRLVIVAPRAWHSTLAEFVEFKRQFREVALVDLEATLAESAGVDDPEKIKRWLYKQWQEAGLGYVLLVGDVDVLPVRYMALDRITPAAFDYSFYPCDLYYADLARGDGSFDDWNSATDSFHARYFGEVRGEKNKDDPINYDQVDYRPEIAVGRWPVQTPDELSRLASKSIAYETSVRNSSPDGPPRAVFVAVGGWVDSRPLMDRLAGRLEPHWKTEKQYYSNKLRPSDSTPTHESVRRVFNNGADLIIHAGHGQPDAWERCFSVADLERLDNAERLPIVLSAGCSTAYFAPLAPYGAYDDVDGRPHHGTDHGELFDAPPPPPSPLQKRVNPTGLGEQILKRNAHGAVAYIGCNTGSQPCGLSLVEGFVAALATDPTPHLGDCWAEAVRYYYVHERLAELKPEEGWYPPSIFFQAMKFMLFGDPSLPLPAGGKDI